MVDDLVGATFCARDGYATPEAVVQGYAAASGARVLQGCAVTGIDVRGGRIIGVETTRGRIATALSYRHFGLTAPVPGAAADLFPSE